MTARQSGDSFRPDIEGLRALAVLLVVGGHCGISVRRFACHTVVNPMRTAASLEGWRLVTLLRPALPPFDIPACVGRRVVHAESCDFDASVALNEAAFSAERAAADGLANVQFLDMNDLICPGSICPATQHDLIVYRDENHLTGTFAGTLAPPLRMRLFQLLKSNSP